MDKKLCIGSLAVAGVMLFLFVLDLLVGFPFGGAGSQFLIVDIFGIIASGILGYLAFSAYREIR